MVADPTMPEAAFATENCPMSIIVTDREILIEFTEIGCYRVGKALTGYLESIDGKQRNLTMNGKPEFVSPDHSHFWLPNILRKANILEEVTM